MRATPVGPSTFVTSSSQPRLPQPGQRLVRELVRADGADEPHLGAEPRRGDGLVRALPPGMAVERGVRSRSPRAAAAARTRATRSRFADPTTVSEAQAASARKSSTARPSRFSRRSKSPAHSDERSGVERDACRGRQTLERADEHGQLEVGLRDPHRGDARRPRERRTGLPLEQLGGSRLAVPGAALARARARARAGSAPSGRSSPASAVSARSAARRKRGLALRRRRAARPRRAPSARAAGRTRAQPTSHADSCAISAGGRSRRRRARRATSAPARLAHGPVLIPPPRPAGSSAAAAFGRRSAARRRRGGAPGGA